MVKVKETTSISLKKTKGTHHSMGAFFLTVKTVAKKAASRLPQIS